MHELVDNIFLIDSVRVEFIGDDFRIVGKPVKIARLQDDAVGKMEQVKKSGIRGRQIKMNPVVIVIGSVTSVVNRRVGRKKEYGIWRNGALFMFVIIPCMLFDKKKKIIVKPGGMQDVAGLFVMGIVAAVEYSYHNLPP